MHHLNRILVRVSGCKNAMADFATPREELIRSARYYAEQETQQYCDRAFDWRETATAGRWESEYPENVILSRENLPAFLAELEDCLEQQRNSIAFYTERLRQKNLTDVDAIVKAFTDRPECHESYCLLCLSELLFGEYIWDSGFFNTFEYTARITRRTIDSIKESPNDWALVMFDHHV